MGLRAFWPSKRILVIPDNIKNTLTSRSEKNKRKKKKNKKFVCLCSS